MLEKKGVAKNGTALKLNRQTIGGVLEDVVLQVTGLASPEAVDQLFKPARPGTFGRNFLSQKSQSGNILAYCHPIKLPAIKIKDQ